MREFLGRFMPFDASAHGGELDRLSAIVHWLMLILFVFWGAYFLYVLWRFNAKNNAKADYAGMKSHWSTWSEAGIAVVEVVLLVGFSIPLWSRWATRPGPDANAAEMRVVGEQFAWNIHYPGNDKMFGKSDVKLVSTTNPLGLDPDDPAGKDDVATLNEMHVELGRPVVVHISSKDVIHSFSLNEMRVKQDAIPGMEVAIHFTPIQANNGRTWEIACAQLCGLGHYRMRGMLVVEPKAEFEAWLKSWGPEDTEAQAPNPVPEATPAEPPLTTTGNAHT